MADIIKVEHLSYVYNPGMPNAVTALDDVSFTVEEGDFVGIIGATGSGKSTLITHMNGLNKPTSGKIYIDGRDLWADPEKIRDFRFLTGLVFQYPEYQLFEETCYKDIAFGPKNMGLDEATAMLDPRGREQVMQTIHHLNKNMGITVVSITHYMEEAAQADRVLVMSKGNVVMEGTPKEVFSQTEKVRALRLDVPQAAELRDELVKAGIPMPEGIIDTGACAQALYELLK